MDLTSQAPRRKPPEKPYCIDCGAGERVLGRISSANCEPILRHKPAVRPRPDARRGGGPLRAAVAAWQAEQGGVALCHIVTAEELATLRSGEPVATELPPNPLGIATSLLAPLRAGPVLLGVLRADYGPESHRFMPEKVAMAGAVAQLVALVIERDRLLSEAAEARAHALALQETTRRMDEFLGIVSHELRVRSP